MKSPSPQQRNVVLHPEFVNGKYAFYTRPMDEFISTGSGGGIGFGLSDSIEHAVISEETIIDPYAAESPAEFFAVMSEAFFEIPQVVQSEYPAVYAQLGLFYKQDPAARLALQQAR